MSLSESHVQRGPCEVKYLTFLPRVFVLHTIAQDSEVFFQKAILILTKVLTLFNVLVLQRVKESVISPE